MDDRCKPHFYPLITGIGSKECNFCIPPLQIFCRTHFHTVSMETIFGSILWMTHVNHIFDPLIIGICSKETHFRIPRPRILSYTHFHSDPTTPILDQIWDFSLWRHSSHVSIGYPWHLSQHRDTITDMRGSLTQHCDVIAGSRDSDFTPFEFSRQNGPKLFQNRRFPTTSVIQRCSL